MFNHFLVRFFKILQGISFSIFACILFSVDVSFADSETEVSGAWRPTLRRSYVFPGSSDKQIVLPDLVAGKEPEAGHGVLAKETALTRVELQVTHEVIDNGRLFARFMGGEWKLQLTEDQGTQQGQDFNFEFGGIYRTKLNQFLSFDTTMGGRVRNWEFESNAIPKHGNIGLILGVTPKVGPVSLLIENTLAAAWLYDLNDLGAQKDSSVLRIRPQYDLLLGNFSIQLGFEYYHQHTEFFGSKVIPGENSFMLDDFELAGIFGASYLF